MRISPSQVQSYDLCKRRWAFKIIENIPEPTSPAQQEGIVGHKRVEGLLTRGDHPGDDALGKLVQAAMRPGFLPVPGPHLLVEHQFNIPLAGVSQVIVDDSGVRRVEGDSFYGFIDCVQPPIDGRVLVTDNKFTSSLEWAKTPADLQTDAQHVGYSRAALEIFQGLPIREVEGRWIYFQKNSTRVKPVSLVRTVEQVLEAWQPIEQKALTMLELRKRKIPAEQLEGNPEACSMYGKLGCPYRDRCSVGRSLGKFDFGSRKVFTRNANNDTQPSSQGEQNMALSLADQLTAMKNKLMGTPAPAPAPAPAVASQGTVAAAQAPITGQATSTVPAASTGPGAALAALQRAKGAVGVNPPAQQPLPGVAAAAPTGLAAKMGLGAPAPTAAPTTPAPAAAPPQATQVPAPGSVGAASTAQVPPASAEAAQLDAMRAQADGAAQGNVAPAPAGLDALKGEKKPRAKKANGATSAPPSQQLGEPRSQLTVLHNVAIVKRPGDNADPVQLIDLLAPIMRKVADDAGKAHWSLIEYGQGKALLAHAFDKWLEESKWKGTVYVNGRSEEAYAVAAVLDAHADLVCRGIA